MLEYLQSNWLSVLLLAVLAICVFLAIRKIIRDRRNGIGSCGHNCSECPASEKCNSKKAE